MACITKLKDRKGYVIDFYDNKGKRRKMTLPKGTTKAKARERLREIEEQIEKGNYIPSKKMPVFSEVAAAWLQHKKANVRASTLKMYDQHLRLHFQDVGGLKVNRITPAVVENFIHRKQDADMNLTTLRKILVTFNQVMSYAVRHRYIDHNPVRDAERPRDRGHTQSAKIRILTPEAINLFLGAVEKPKYRTLFMLAVMSGARQGELLGLKWTDIDWFNSQIHIQRTFNCGQWYRPKSATSNRKIDLGPSMMNELKKWKIACPASDLDLVFPNEAGHPINHGNMLSRHFFPALKRAGLHRMRFHDLRHTYASLLIEQGENVKYIQTQLGHASPTVTLNVYAHLMNSVNQEAPARLEKAVFEKSGNNMGTINKKGSMGFPMNP